MTQITKTQITKTRITKTRITKTRITMSRLAWSEVRQHPTRYAATLAATALGVAFVVALLVFVPTQFRSIGVRATAQTAVADVVVADVADPHHTLAAEVAGVDGVALAEPRYQTLAEFSADGRPGTIALSSLPTDPRLRWLDLDQGRWPASPDELVVGSATAEAYHLVVGEPITVALADSESGTASARTQRTLRVVGITDEGHSLFAGSQATGAAPASLFGGDLATYPTVLALANPGVSPEQLRDAIRAVVPRAASVRTSDQVATETMNQLSGGVQAGYLLLLVFGPIALLVGGMIITNTQLLVLTQRRRQLALLRVVGAGCGQLRASLLAETLLVGLLGSVVGVVLGLGLAAGLSAASDSLAGGLVIPVGRVLLAVAVGLVVGLGASLVPTWRATRVSPVEALRPVADAAHERRIGRVRLAIGGALLLTGGAAVALVAWYGRGFPLTVAGSALLAVGIIVLAPTYVPPLLRLLGRLVGGAGPTARLAAANLSHHPRRTAATASALMLAVGLIVALQVGAASVKASVEAEVARQFPVDVTVESADVAVTSTVRTAVAAVLGVEAVEPVAMTDATAVVVGGSGGGSGESGGSGGGLGGSGGGAALTVVGLAPTAARVARGGLDALQPGVALVHPFTLESVGAKEGQTVRLSAGGRHVDVRVVKSDLADAGRVVVPQATLDVLAAKPLERALWVRTDHQHPAQVIADVKRATSSQLGLVVGGSLVQSAAIGATVDAVLLVATALLGVAALIAVIGVGATIGLSVIERVRESALLRALGVQRRQLRVMLAVEAGLLAVAATLVGATAGIGFGVIGTTSLAHEIGVSQVRLAVSIPQTALVIAVALVAGLLASVLPGRRAARTEPAAVLADD